MTPSRQARIISRRVTRYETPDGRQHDTLTAARRHQIKCDLHDVIKHDEHLALKEVDTLYVVDLLCDNAAELSQLLRRFMQLEQIKVSKPEGVKLA